MYVRVILLTISEVFVLEVCLIKIINIGHPPHIFLCSMDATTYQMFDEDDISKSGHSVSMVESSQFTDDYTGDSTPALGAMEKKEKAKVI